MEKERLKQIGSFLNDRLIIHRNVENDTPWTAEEKMIKELYDSYLDLLIEYNKQKEIIDKAINIIKQEIPEEYIRSCDTSDGTGRYELDTESWQYKVYGILKEVK